MATTDRTTATGALARRLDEAEFVHLVVRADGESLAAAGILAAGLDETPFQASAVRTRAEVDDRAETAVEPTLIGVGLPGVDGPTERPAVAAFEAAESLGSDPDPALALAGVVAGGGRPEDEAPDLLSRAGLERRAGIAVPTLDLADGLAHTTHAHVACSGDPDAAESVVAEVGDDDVDRRLASLLAIEAVTADGATDRAAEAIERAVHPLAGGPCETVEGTADVLWALAATAPGLGVALAVGDGSDAALAAWRDHARAAHAGVRSAETTRHDGLLVAHTDGPVEAVARLLRDYRSPEPAVLAVGDGEAALATVDRPAEPVEAAAGTAGGSGLARGNYGYARVDDQQAFVDAVVEAV